MTLKALALAAGMTAAANLAVAGAPEPIDGDSPETASNPITLHTGANLNQVEAAGLVQRAAEQGEIRVIIGLSMTMEDEDSLSAAEEATQLNRLQAVQNQVQSRSLAGVPSDRIDHYDTIPYMSAWVTAAELENLLSDPQVISIQEDVPLAPTLNKSVPLIQSNKLWAKNLKGKGNVVVIVDTGVFKNHAMIVDDWLPGACYSTTNASQSSTSVCKGGAAEELGKNAGRNCPLSIDGCDHGTHVAGIAAGWSDKARGVAFVSKIVSVQVFSRFDSVSTCGGSAPCVLSFTTDQVKGLEQIFKWKRSGRYNIVSVNMSLGGGAFTGPCDSASPAMTSIVTKLLNKNVATVIASGNSFLNGRIGFPACISNAIAVGSSTKTDQISSFSNHGPMVKVLAPGSDIRSTAAGSKNALSLKSGTSMAAPHVAGAWSLLRNFKPNASVQEIATALICTGKQLQRPGNNLSKPRIKLLDAWRYLKRPPTQSQTWNFTAKADGNDWNQLLGTWTVAGGSYKLKNFNPNGIWNASWHPGCHQRLTATMTMRRVDTSGSHFNSGMLVKSDVHAQTKTISGYWFGYNSFGGGQAFILRLDGVNFGSGTGSAPLLCLKDNVSVNVGGNNTLKVVSNGPVHKFLLNGKSVCSATDPTYLAGSVGQLVAIPRPLEGKQSFQVSKVVLKPTAPSSGSEGTALMAAAGGAEVAPSPAPESGIQLGTAF